MATRSKTLFFVLLAVYMIAPLVLVFFYMEKTASLIFLCLPTLYLLFVLFRWTETAKVLFRVLLFFIVIINTIILFHLLLLETYQLPATTFPDYLPFDLLLHGAIAGFVIAIVCLILLYKIKPEIKREQRVMGALTFLLLAVTIGKAFIS